MGLRLKCSGMSMVIHSLFTGSSSRSYPVAHIVAKADNKSNEFWLLGTDHAEELLGRYNSVFDFQAAPVCHCSQFCSGDDFLDRSLKGYQFTDFRGDLKHLKNTGPSLGSGVIAHLASFAAV